MASGAAQLEEDLRRHPDDWERWLVYADWLSEQGDPRGELIGLEHRRDTARLDDDERASLVKQIAKINKRNKKRWSLDLPEGCSAAIAHGFATAVTYSLSELDGLASLLGDPRAVLVGELRLRAVRDLEAEGEDVYDEDYEPPKLDESVIDALVDAGLSRLTRLAIEYSLLGDDAASRLLACSDLAGLRSLDLRYTHVGDQTAVALARADHLTNLEQLKLQNNRIGPDGVRALCGAPHLGGLRELDLRENPIGAEGAMALAASSLVRGLDSLWLYHNDIGDDGARALGASPELPRSLGRYWAARAATPES